MLMLQSPTGGTSGMALEHGKVHPKALHSNSTSHVWPFSAIAELVDNAQDSEARASNVWIEGQGDSASDGPDDIVRSSRLTVEDDGSGMTRMQLHRMLSFGFSEKEHQAGNVGRFGMGFKSGSMRLGLDVVVLSRETDTVSIALLSQTFLTQKQADDVLIPMLTWKVGEQGLEKMQPQNEQSWAEAMEVITTFSFMKSEEAVLAAAQSKLMLGTRITIFNLKLPAELDFDSDPLDIRVAQEPDVNQGPGRRSTSRPFQQARPLQPVTTVVKEDFSLRAYLEILYLTPQIRIFLRGQEVIPRDPCDLMVRDKKYMGSWKERESKAEPSLFWFGYPQDLKTKLCGVHVYHKNRLILLYEKFGPQRQNNATMKNLLGVATLDCVDPIHNKQDFNRQSPEYRKFDRRTVEMMNDYYANYQTTTTAGIPSRRRGTDTKKRARPEDTQADGVDEEDISSGSEGRRRSPQRERPRAPKSRKMMEQPLWVEAALATLASISKKKEAIWFRKPVDTELLRIADYHEVIKNPMDYAKLRAKLQSGEYKTRKEFEDDFRLIRLNAVHYNGGDHECSRAAMMLEEAFLKLWSEVLNELPTESSPAPGARPSDNGAEARPPSTTVPTQSHLHGSLQLPQPQADPVRRTTSLNDASAPRVAAAASPAPGPVHQRAGQYTGQPEAGGVPPEALQPENGQSDAQGSGAGPPKAAVPSPPHNTTGVGSVAASAAPPASAPPASPRAGLSIGRPVALPGRKTPLGLIPRKKPTQPTRTISNVSDQPVTTAPAPPHAAAATPPAPPGPNPSAPTRARQTSSHPQTVQDSCRPLPQDPPATAAAQAALVEGTSAGGDAEAQRLRHLMREQKARHAAEIAKIKSTEAKEKDRLKRKINELQAQVIMLSQELNK